MPILNGTQIAAAARAFAQSQFVVPNNVANLSLTDIITAITAIDTAMASSVASFASTYSGASNVGAAMGTAVGNAVPTATNVQKGTMLIFWCMQVTGIQ